MRPSPRLVIAAAGTLVLVTAIAAARTGSDHPSAQVAAPAIVSASSEQPRALATEPAHRDEARGAVAGSGTAAAVPAPAKADATAEFDPEILAAAQILRERAQAARRADAGSTSAAATASTPAHGIGLPEFPMPAAASGPFIDFAAPDRQPPRSDPRRAGGVWINCAPGYTTWPEHPAPLAPDGSG